MNRSLIRNPSIIVTILLGLVSAMAVAALVTHPAQAFNASLSGLQFWWNIVFPAMLPYMILIRIASVYGLFHVLGRLLEPLARLLKLPPGSGSILSEGLLLGGAAGSLGAARERDRFAPEETARLAATVGTANPVLVLTVLGVSLLQNPAAGLFLLAVHYAAWFLCALAFSAVPRTIRTRSSPKPPAPRPEDDRTGGRLRNTRRSFGHALGDSVTDSLQSMLELGGIIIAFAVMANLAGLSGIPGIAATLLNGIGFRQAGEWMMPLLAGFLEIHNGIRQLAGLVPSSPGTVLALLGAMLAWGGAAVQLEVRARLRKAGIGIGRTILFRIVHAAFAIGLTTVLWPFVRHRFDPWPIRGNAENAAAWPALWPEVHGMPQAALVVAALSALLLVRLWAGRLFRRAR